ncbi:MAG: CoA ester lyase [Celeribacter sp.]|jgi:citrate lyase subunit beta/citryl-CoA lyase
MRLRSLLYVPAHVDRFVDKAAERGADAIILDLEDAVPEGEKDAARAALARAVPQVGRSGAQVFVRINATARADADARAALAAGADGLMLPKIESPADLDRLPDGCARVIGIIESAFGLLAAPQIAAHPRLAALCLGAEDFATDTGAVPDAETLHLPKLMVHYAAKASGKLSLGLLRSAAQFSDPDDLRRAAAEAVRFGFDGATCIHPKVVAVLNDAFTPDAVAVARARAIITAARRAATEGSGAFMLDGEFIDAPIIARAERLLTRAGLAPAPEPPK